MTPPPMDPSRFSPDGRACLESIDLDFVDGLEPLRQGVAEDIAAGVPPDVVERALVDHARFAAAKVKSENPNLSDAEKRQFLAFARDLVRIASEDAEAGRLRIVHF